MEAFAFVELLAFAERFFVVEPLPAEPALRLDFAVAAFREVAFGLPAPPDPFAEVREAALLALLPFELERFLVAPELERFVLEPVPYRSPQAGNEYVDLAFPNLREQTH